jgi:signal transduction histidine kinase
LITRGAVRIDYGPAVLVRAVLLLLLAAVPFPLFPRAAATEPPLTTAAAVRALSFERASELLPVELRATVTLVDPGRTVFIQDETGGTFIRSGLAEHGPLEPGTVLRVKGVSYPGLYVAGVDSKDVEIAGRAPLPEPVEVTFEELASGHRHYEWVRTTGVVRAVEVSGEQSILLLSSGNGRIEIHAPEALVPDHLVDSVIRVDGLAAGYINDKRQMVTPHLRLRSAQDIRIITPPPADPFSREPVSASDLLRFSPQERPGHRVKVIGTVTLQQAGRTLFLRDGEDGVRIETAQSSPVKIGDQVEVLGFPAMGRFSALLQDAIFRVVGPAEDPPPRETAANDLLNGARDADLVRIAGQLVRTSQTADELILLVQAGELLLQARLAGRDAERSIPRAGSTVQLTGVCQVLDSTTGATGFRSQPQSVELLLRSPSDIIVLRSAPWWTAARLAATAAILLALTAIAFAWVALLRFQVSRQTLLLRDKLQAEAVAEERQRLAREFHDTLEQELVGLTLRLDALATKITEQKPRELLQATRRLVQRLQAEARMLVWDLRERSGERTDLPSAILEATSAIAGAAELDLTVTGESVALASLTQHHLVRIAQESVTNAIKHGHATRIEIRLNFAPRGLTIEIQDDGTGFNPDPAQQRPGHFGLVGMRERARKVNGDLEIISAEGTGTLVRIRLGLVREGAIARTASGRPIDPPIG